MFFYEVCSCVSLRSLIWYNCINVLKYVLQGSKTVKRNKSIKINYKAKNEYTSQKGTKQLKMKEKGAKKKKKIEKEKTKTKKDKKKTIKNYGGDI